MRHKRDQPLLLRLRGELHREPVRARLPPHACLRRGDQRRIDLLPRSRRRIKPMLRLPRQPRLKRPILPHKRLRPRTTQLHHLTLGIRVGLGSASRISVPRTRKQQHRRTEHADRCEQSSTRPTDNTRDPTAREPNPEPRRPHGDPPRNVSNRQRGSYTAHRTTPRARAKAVTSHRGRVSAGL